MLRVQTTAAIFAMTMLSFCFTAVASADDAPQTETQKLAEKDEKAMVDQLSRTLPQVIFKGNSLVDVIDFMRDAIGANIFVDWPALDAVGVEHDAAVTYKAIKAPFGASLSGVLAKAAGDPKKLTYSTDAGVIYISTPDGVKKHQELWRTHAALSTDKVEKFKAVLPSIRLNGNSFSDVVNFIRDASGCKIECDWDQLKKEGIEKDAPVTMKVSKIPTLMVFQMLAEEASNEKATLDFRIDGDTVKFFATPVKKP
jgi:hypothetical protein